MKKLALAVMLGIGVMVSGCGNIDTATMDNNIKQAQENQVKYLTSENVDKPDLRVGDKVKFDDCKPKFQIGTMNNGRKILNLTYGGKHGVTLYIVDVTELPENTKGVMIVDNVMTMVDDAQTHKMSGYYTGTDDKVIVTTVIGHAKECK